MTWIDRALLVGACLFGSAASYNSIEAHRHMHEIGCTVGNADLCEWAKK